MSLLLALERHAKGWYGLPLGIGTSQRISIVLSSGIGTIQPGDAYVLSLGIGMIQSRLVRCFPRHCRDTNSWTQIVGGI